MEFLLRGGADVERILDGERLPIERFAAHLARIPALSGGGPPPLVVLSRTNPTALMVLKARRVLEHAVPKLSAAPWIIFFDEAENPFFALDAANSGELDVPLDSAPIWSNAQGDRYLILPEHLAQIDLVARRIAELEAESLVESGVHPIAPHAPTSATDHAGRAPLQACSSKRRV